MLAGSSGCLSAAVWVHTLMRRKQIHSGAISRCLRSFAAPQCMGGSRCKMPAREVIGIARRAGEVHIRPNIRSSSDQSRAGCLANPQLVSPTRRRPSSTTASSASSLKRGWWSWVPTSALLSWSRRSSLFNRMNNEFTFKGRLGIRVKKWFPSQFRVQGLCGSSWCTLKDEIIRDGNSGKGQSCRSCGRWSQAARRRRRVRAKRGVVGRNHVPLSFLPLILSLLALITSALLLLACFHLHSNFCTLNMRVRFTAMRAFGASPRPSGYGMI